jgi:arylsulfatase A-like enzyme
MAGTTRRRFLQAAGASATAAVVGQRAWAQRLDAPNVILIVVDTVRSDHVFGHRARTPNIDALAREGLSFTRTYPEAMPTVAARNSILSGRRRFPFRGWREHRAQYDPGWVPLPRPGDAFTTLLRRAGYWTAYATDNPFLGFDRGYRPLRQSFNSFRRRGGPLAGNATGVSERELRRWVPPALDVPRTRDRVRRYLAHAQDYFDDERRSFAARVFGDAARMLGVAAAHRPFALVVDTYQPHEPWTPPRSYVDLYGDPDYRGPEPARPHYAHVDNYLHGRDRDVLLARMRALYAASLTLTDRWLGVFLDSLHELGLERETTLVLVGDHGFYLGERGWTGKIHWILHPELTHVPLIVVDPARRSAGRTSRYYASTHDVAPTILSMLGLPVPQAMDGNDLSPLFAGGRLPERRLAWGGYQQSFYIRTDHWVLFGPDSPAKRQLFDLRRDPGERRNVIRRHGRQADELYSAVLRRAGGGLPFGHRMGAAGFEPATSRV